VSSAIAKLVAEKSPNGERKNPCTWRHPLIESLKLPGYCRTERARLHDGHGWSRTCHGGVEERRTKSKEKSWRPISCDIRGFCLARPQPWFSRRDRTRPARISCSLHSRRGDRAGSDSIRSRELYAFSSGPRAERRSLTNCMTLISAQQDRRHRAGHGPRAHGPREVYIYVVVVGCELPLVVVVVVGCGLWL